MTRQRTAGRRAVTFGLAVVAGTVTPGLPAPQDAQPPRPAEPVATRRELNTEPTVLAFKNVTVEQVVPFLVETTGKVVLPQPGVLPLRITILNDQPIPRERALDLVILALQQAGVAVVETPDLILLRDIAEIDRQDVPVLGPDESVLERGDLGSIVEKVFALRHAAAENVAANIRDSIPSFAKLTFDADSNQLVVMGNIGLLQRIERLVLALDRPNIAALVTETFHLRYADAEQVATNIRELFTADGASSAGARATRAGQQAGRQQQGSNQPGQPGAGQRGGFQPPTRTGESVPTTSSNLRVTFNTQQNSVTVLAEPELIRQIREQVVDAWDLPLPDEAVVPRVYELRNSDPVKVRNLLEGLFGQGTPTTVGGGGGGQQRTTVMSQGVGRLAGQFSFQAIPEASRLVVVAKSPDNLAVIDKIIEGLDQPQTSGLPAVVELKHASAEELAEQLNTLIAQEGTIAQIPRAETGLSESSATVSPFASDQADQTDEDPVPTSSTLISFWWQRARPPTDAAGASNLVGKVRLVPVWRQNAILVMAAPEYQRSVVDLIQSLDRPGRQVLISAVVAELSVEDAEAVGLRWSSQQISPTNPDNSISIGASGTGPTFTGQKNDLLPGLFDTSVLDIGVDLNLILQALAQNTDISILSEPKVFTADNQEAEFFDGQDIPFITDSQTTDQGNVVQSFDYRAVGIQLRVRPRITLNRDVDLRVNLELSSVQPQQTLFGGFIVDRRETTTQLIVRDGQTVVISGIIRAEDADILRKVPLLGDIPLVGLLFQSTERTKRNKELVAFITPRVVESPTDSDTLNQPYRERLEEMRRQLRPPEEQPTDGPDPAPPLDADRSAPIGDFP